MQGDAAMRAAKGKGRGKVAIRHGGGRQDERQDDTGPHRDGGTQRSRSLSTCPQAITARRPRRGVSV